MSASAYPPIGDYGIIGDCHTAALISKAGSIDWFCPGRFDAPAVFCRLLDAERGGCLSLAGLGACQQRAYEPGTALLRTTFASAGGTASAGSISVTDFMPIFPRAPHRRGHDVGSVHRLSRLIELSSGRATIRLTFKPTFDFARQTTTFREEDGAVVAQGGQERLRLCIPGMRLAVPAGGGQLDVELALRPGQPCWLVVDALAANDQPPAQPDASRCRQELEETRAYWQRWASVCRYEGPYRDAVLRSAVTLKLLIYEPTGAVVAAPTTSLPEVFGGVRNWDYRYTWLRDASLTIYALTTLGWHEEATDFVHWLRQTCRHVVGAASAMNHQAPQAEDASPQIMYTIDGARELPEQEVRQLAGYRDSSPVRTGNAAVDQRQLDIYGDVLAAVYHAYHLAVPATEAARNQEGAASEELHEPPPGVSPSRTEAAQAAGSMAPDEPTWQMLSSLVNMAARNWDQPDSGIWEHRGAPQPFTYSKLMCWVALDRGLRFAREHDLPAPVEAWEEARERVRQTILTRGYNADLGAFTRTLDGHDLDASLLAIPRFGFLAATDPRMVSTVAAIQAGLSERGFILRYQADDALPGSEATFTLCTLWLVDALALGGKLDEARQLFECVLGTMSDLGLLSEEFEPATGELAGNFPQGFSHMAVIGAALNLKQASELGPEHQASTEPQRARRLASTMR
ncbi:MAG TPA: glycoside hydrolase family 15 protein [Chloroflexota bacterium]|nr:glycoside hydrolase family 15 protein [Chloroflexota bacterium]